MTRTFSPASTTGNFIAAALLVALAACSDMPKGVGGQVITLESAQMQPTDTEDFSVGEPYDEARKLRHSANLASRQGKNLLLRLDDGQTKTYTNSDVCESHETCIFYNYLGLLANAQFYWLRAAFYEGGDDFLISRRSGVEYSMEMAPHPSPDKKFLVVASDCETYCEAGVYLWEVVNGELVEQFKLVPTDYQLFTFNRWVGSDRIEMTTQIHSEQCAGSLLVFPVQLMKQADGWFLLEDNRESEARCI